MKRPLCCNFTGWAAIDQPLSEQHKHRKPPLQVLKQKKMLENQRDQLYNQQYNMEQTSFALESMKDSVNQVKAMKAANKELKSAFGQKELNISSIDKLHDDMADMMVSFPISTSHFST